MHSPPPPADRQKWELEKAASWHARLRHDGADQVNKMVVGDSVRAAGREHTVGGKVEVEGPI